MSSFNDTGNILQSDFDMWKSFSKLNGNAANSTSNIAECCSVRYFLPWKVYL